MSGDRMCYPNTPLEFIKKYSFKDIQEIYTNGGELIPVFRVEQMIEHYMQKSNDHQEDLISRKSLLDKWDKLSTRGRTEFDQVIMLEPQIDIDEAIDRSKPKKPIYSRLYATTPDMQCPVCGKYLLTDYPKFCSDCGQKIDWEA